MLDVVEMGAPSDVQALVLCNTHELALQLCDEFERFAKYLPCGHRILRAVGKIPTQLQAKPLKDKLP